MSQPSSATLEKITALCKRRGFVYQSSEIYGGLNGVYDFGPLGSLMKQNIRSAWSQAMMKANDAIVFMDGSILGSYDTWKASGHIDNFSDPMVDCLNCKKRYRTDEIDLERACPHCGKKAWTEARMFNMMFQTQMGPLADPTAMAYLRPETAQAIFINFKNVISTSRVKIPFGIAQIGKAFRNEITPKQFLFRMREFEQMEMEWFCKDAQAMEYFKFWADARKAFYQTIGLDPARIRLREHAPDERAHYSTACIDVEYQFPFGWKEIEGIAHRGTFDLTQHSKHSGKDLNVFDEETKSSYTPTVIECSVGVDRLFLTLLFDAYHEDIIEGEERVVLRLNPRIAPIKAAFMPLTKKQVDPLYQIYARIRAAGFMVQFDESGSIGKRYRRQDEIGTPFCFTYDFESEKDNTVTVRHRDSTKQERINIDDIQQFLEKITHE